MNLAEFPLTVMGKRPPRGVKTLTFRDEITDPETAERVPRELTVTGSDLLGLPTSYDEEVLIGLEELTHQASSPSRRVCFTPYAFLEQIGWERSTRNYRRLTKSLDRWASVTIISKEAFWSKGKRQRVRDVVGILDRWQVVGKNAMPDAETKTAFFVWSDFVWESIEAGYVRGLDVDFWRGLENPISRRLFRFLGKKFYARSEVPFELKQLAFEKVGVSRKHHTGQIKESLEPAHHELERKGFCRANYIDRGQSGWEVVYTDLRTETGKKAAVRDSLLLKQLQERGCTDASLLLRRQRNRSRIERAILNFDDRLCHGEKISHRWLAGDILSKDGYDFREGYKSPECLRQEAEATREGEQKSLARKQSLLKQTIDRKASAKAAFAEFWTGLSEVARKDFQAEAIRCSRVHGKLLAAENARTNRHFQVYLDTALLEHWRRTINGAPQAGAA
ncbi:replication initiator protein A [Botrimarina mediterranea]|nr:replication initiator protein A [Botrimarina mediterranea]